MLESALLLFLHREPAHGYTLLEQLGEFDLAGVDPSVIYRALRDMEAQGWVTSTWDEEQTQGPPRRVYRITASGDEVLASWVQDLDETKKMIDRLVGAYRVHMKKGEGEHHTDSAKKQGKEAE
jgi:PadR family transcriptional regulator PadR